MEGPDRCAGSGKVGALPTTRLYLLGSTDGRVLETVARTMNGTLPVRLRPPLSTTSILLLLVVRRPLPKMAKTTVRDCYFIRTIQQLLSFSTKMMKSLIVCVSRSHLKTILYLMKITLIHRRLCSQTVSVSQHS